MNTRSESELNACEQVFVWAGIFGDETGELDSNKSHSILPFRISKLRIKSDHVVSGPSRVAQCLFQLHMEVQNSFLTSEKKR